MRDRGGGPNKLGSCLAKVEILNLRMFKGSGKLLRAAVYQHSSFVAYLLDKRTNQNKEKGERLQPLCKTVAGRFGIK